MKHRTGKNRRQMFFSSIDDMVCVDSFARVIDILVDHLPLAELGFSHTCLNSQGNEPYDPKALFKLLIYGQRFALRSANRLAKSCKINLEVIWLLQGLEPSARTICYFRVNNTSAIKNAHRHFVKLLKSWHLIGGDLLALDGTKIRGQNSIKNNFNEKKINRHIKYIDDKIDEYLQELSDCGEKQSKKKRASKLRKKIEIYEHRRSDYEQLERQVKESSDGQVSTTDPDSRSVIMHRNIVEVGYNIQTTVDADYMMIVDVYAGGVNDRSELGLAAKRAQDLLGNEKIDLLADAGYHNGADIAYCERKGIRTFIPPSKRNYRKEAGFREHDFQYDKQSDSYTCPDGQKLDYELTYKKKNSKRKYRVKRYGTENCKGCALRSKCTVASAGRKIERANHEESAARNNKRVKRYYEYYRLPQQIVEPIFGIWKRQWHFDHVLLRGKDKVETEITLAAITYNLMRVIKIKGFEWLEKAMKRAHFRRIENKMPPYGLGGQNESQKTLTWVTHQVVRIAA